MTFNRCDNEDAFRQPFEMDAEQTPPDADGEASEMPMEIGNPPGTNTRRKVTFLDLPQDVKIRILQYAGLLRPCPIDILVEKHRPKPNVGLCGNGKPLRMTRIPWTAKWMSPYYGPCDHPPLPVKVFLASRAIRQELGSLFFSRSLFSIHIYGRQDFRVFNAATEWGLLHLKHLHLTLGAHYRYLKLSRGIHRTTLNIWTQFCQNAKEKMPALRYFSLKCKVKELDVASRLMCIMDPFPTLAHCAFHFSDNQDDDIRPVIKRAAWRLTGNLTDDKPPFPFAKLPKEVQLMILEHVLVSRSDPFLSAIERNAAMVGLFDRKCQPTSGSALSCCCTCSPLRAACFCDTRQTAFSTSCTCFSSPLPYFLVSQEFYQDCRRVFFAKCHFMFVDEEPDPVMRFLNSIPTSYSMQIRRLSFKFPMTFRNYARTPKAEEAMILSWSVLRRFIREHFDLPRLSLSVIDHGTRGSSINRNKYNRRVLKAFTELQGLREFRVFLADDPSFEKELERLITGRATVGRYQPYHNMRSLGNHIHFYDT